MRKRRWVQLALVSTLVATVLAIGSQPAATQGQAPAGGFKCNVLHAELPVAGSSDLTSSDPDKLTPIDNSTKDQILKSGLPCDAINTDRGPAALPIANRQRGFDFYSWLTFIALNSPSGKPGEIATSQADTKAMWEDGTMFKPLLDVMLTNGEVPDWNKPIIPKACEEPRAKPGNKDRMLVKMIEESFNEPFKTGALIDQHNNYAIFDILMNRVMFDYIVEHRLYSKTGQASDENSSLRVDFPAGHHDKTTGLGDPGAIMLKVSWKILTEDEVKSNRFHVVKALVAMPEVPDETGTPPCLEKDLGLVGMHIVHKTATRPQWIWSSFEHADNVPEIKDVQAPKLNPSYNFFDPSCLDEKKCPFNATPPRPWDPEYANKLQFHTLADGKQFHSQIVRMTNLSDATNTINGAFQSILGDTVWKNYIMIGTQWPSSFPCTGDHTSSGPDPKTDFDKQPDMNCAPAPTFLANSTLETFSQGKTPQASSSCMACHGNATSYLRRSANATNDPGEKFMNQSDFTFMLEKAR